MQSLNHPQLGFVIKMAVSVPAGATVPLPRPTFPSEYGHPALLYQFSGDNAQAVELVVNPADTVGTTIPATMAWDYGGADVSMFSKGYYRYLHNNTATNTSITVAIQRVV